MDVTAAFAGRQSGSTPDAGRPLVTLFGVDLPCASEGFPSDGWWDIAGEDLSGRSELRKTVAHPIEPD